MSLSQVRVRVRRVGDLLDRLICMGFEFSWPISKQWIIPQFAFGGDEGRSG
ncbi:MAG: hypothetical protein ACMG55_00280 [Microcoleus sp.]